MICKMFLKLQNGDCLRSVNLCYSFSLIRYYFEQIMTNRQTKGPDHPTLAHFARVLLIEFEDLFKQPEERITPLLWYVRLVENKQLCLIESSWNRTNGHCFFSVGESIFTPLTNFLSICRQIIYSVAFLRGLVGSK